MQHRLYYSKFEDTFVVLDLMPDRYRLLQGEAALRFGKLAEGHATAEDIDWFGVKGFSAEALAAIGDARSYASPTRSIDFRHQDKAGFWLTAKACWLQWRYRKLLRRKPLHLILASMENLRVNAAADQAGKLLAVAIAFERAKLVIPTRDQCLARALAMSHLLRRSGVQSDLVFGVTLPFSAHCWVQQGNVVLSDPVDRVRAYQPIMALT